MSIRYKKELCNLGMCLEASFSIPLQLKLSLVSCFYKSHNTIKEVSHHVKSKYMEKSSAL